MPSSLPQPPSVTVIIPTYAEAKNLPELLDRLARTRTAHGLVLDVLIMDDDSRDGSVELVKARAESWVRIVVRTAKRGLSQAVLDGLRLAQGDVLVCMDADLSHPPEALPDMLAALDAGADFVIGSRYVAGGSTSDDWTLLRWMNSRVATLLARPLTAARDPMAGFFALGRATFEHGRDFRPVGYKIGLELIVKCGCQRVVEIPIHFSNRRLGRSKLTLRQQVLYLEHLRRLYWFRFLASPFLNTEAGAPSPAASDSEGGVDHASRTLHARRPVFWYAVSVLLLVCTALFLFKAGHPEVGWEIVKPPGSPACSVVVLAPWDALAKEHMGRFSSRDEAELQLQRFKATPDPMTGHNTICE